MYGGVVRVAYGFLQPGLVLSHMLYCDLVVLYAGTIILGLSCNRGRWHEINRP